MSKELYDIVKEAIVENLDTSLMIQEWSEDIANNDPEWWAKQIVKPLKNELVKAIREKENLIKEILYQIMETEFPYRKLESILEEEAKNYIKNFLPRITIKIEKD